MTLPDPTHHVGTVAVHQLPVRLAHRAGSGQGVPGNVVNDLVTQNAGQPWQVMTSQSPQAKCPRCIAASRKYL